ncbi:MAG: hypothetical protein WCI21_03010 [Alphaproteobacteria bacterium]
MKQTFDERVVVVGLARDSAQHLGAVFANIDSMASCFMGRAYLFLENDSADQTRDYLEAFRDARPGCRLEHFDGLASSQTVPTVRRAWLRSHYLSVIARDFADYDVLVVVDCDEANTFRIDHLAFRRAIEFLNKEPDCAGVFPNQDGVYDDLSALRHPTWCPGDAWEEALDYFLTKGGTDGEVFHACIEPHLRTLGRYDAPIEVTSAFGGMGIYKMSSVIRNERRSTGYKTKTMATPEGVRPVGWQVSEHVEFNRGFGENGQKLFILPFFVNRQTAGHFEALSGWMSPSTWRNQLFELSQLAPPP